MKKSWRDFMASNLNDQRIDSIEAIAPNEKLIELAGKLLEQNRIILNTNHMIFQAFASYMVICKTSYGKEDV